MKLKILFFAYILFNASPLFAQKSSSNNLNQCTETYLTKRVKELIFENIEHDFPGVLKPDLTFSKNNGTALNEMLNDSLKNVINQQITMEFKGCSFMKENFQIFSDSKKQENTKGTSTAQSLSSAGRK